MRMSRRISIGAALAGIVTVFTMTATSLAQGPPPGAPPADQGRGGREGGRGGGGGGGGLGAKAAHLPASVWNSSSTVARTKLRHEWVNVQVGDRRLRTWVEYPAGEGRAPVVLVLQHYPGLDDWMRGVADQLATEGFIAVAPDLYSGFGPNGGNYDSFATPDEAMRQAGPRLTPAEAMRRAQAAAQFGLKLPRSNGALGALGVGTGGTLSFRFAAEAPTVHAAVVFYGASPDESILRQIKAPVIGFYGEDDEVTTTLAATAAAMTTLGKPFEVHRYPGATNAFLAIQVEGLNGQAVGQAWPRATAFLKEHLSRAGGNQ